MLEIRGGRLVEARCERRDLEEDFWSYCHTDENSDRVGELAFGTIDSFLLWRLCGGGALPPASPESPIEFSHRSAATVVSVLLLWMAIHAFRKLREHRFIVRGSIAAGLLVLAQAALGGLTVEEGLHVTSPTAEDEITRLVETAVHESRRMRVG